MDLLAADPATAAARVWAGLDEPWQEAFGQAWEATPARVGRAE